MLDFVGRATLIAFFGCLASLKAMAAITFLQHWPRGEPIQNVLDFGSQLAALAFILLIIFMTLVRLKPLNTARGWEPRFSALMGTFLTCLLPLLPQTEISPTLQIISIVLIVCGFSLSIWVARWLGRSLSVTAQARKLITRGPYAIVRHPLYLTEEIAVVGLILSHFSLEAMLLGAVQWAFQLRRMANEERVLRSTFSEYADYANKTPKLIPNNAFRALRKSIDTSAQQVSSSIPDRIERRGVT
jgi:protein-S-isoprenylcysteine O-methyltransferase Ste14